MFAFFCLALNDLIKASLKNHFKAFNLPIFETDF